MNEDILKISYEDLLRELRDFHDANQGLPLVGPD